MFLDIIDSIIYELLALIYINERQLKTIIGNKYSQLR